MGWQRRVNSKRDVVNAVKKRGDLVMKKTKVITKLIAIILSILVVVQVAPMSTFAETIETESEKFEESGYYVFC